MVDKYTKELERALNPREWDKELNDTWHKNIPDLQKAFDEIREIAKNRSKIGDKMKHTIEIEGLPGGWEPVAIRKQKLGEYIFCLDTGFVVPANHRTPKAHLIVKKKQPRRIVLEETEEENHLYESGQYAAFSAGEFVISGVRNKWREVKDSGGE